MVKPWRLGTTTTASATGAIVGTVSPAPTVGGGSGSGSSAGTISGSGSSLFTVSSTPPVMTGAGGTTTDDGVGSTGSGRLRNPVQSSAASAAMTRMTTTIVGTRLPRAGGD